MASNAEASLAGMDAPRVEQLRLHARHALRHRWLYIVGDSSMRMLFGAIVWLLNGSLADPRFGSFVRHSHGGCMVNLSAATTDPRCRDNLVHPSVELAALCLPACTREYVDLRGGYRVTFSFKTFVDHPVREVEQLVSPSHVPAVMLLATGAWDISYRPSAVDPSEKAIVSIADTRLLAERVVQWGEGVRCASRQGDSVPRVVFATLVTCHWRERERLLGRAFNAAIRQMLRGTRQNSSESPLSLLDREPTTNFTSPKRPVKLSQDGRNCEGWHAYGAVVLEHIAEFLHEIHSS
ncbi:hypothetical protein AB1Y20_014051 [Prymnesium parvum]|uniref:Uncharacterized protein n=1 Tax=Prymnesium parvum TaxID=97485 RepID=A0AB34IGV2_PRYPA